MPNAQYHSYAKEKQKCKISTWKDGQPAKSEHDFQTISFKQTKVDGLFLQIWGISWPL